MSTEIWIHGIITNVGYTVLNTSELFIETDSVVIEILIHHKKTEDSAGRKNS